MEGDFAEMETSEGQSAARDGLKAELTREISGRDAATDHRDPLMGVDLVSQL